MVLFLFCFLLLKNLLKLNKEDNSQEELDFSVSAEIVH